MERLTSKPLIVLISGLLIVHLVLLGHELRDPSAILLGDRAYERIEEVLHLASTDGTANMLSAVVHSGNPGDYVFQGLLYRGFGVYGVIIVQILLQLAAVVYVFRLGCLVFSSTRPALLAALGYALLPASLFQPHVLMSEAWFNPLVIIAFYYAARYLVEGGEVGRPLLIAAAVGSIATFVRPVYGLYPLLFAIILVVLTDHPKKWRRASQYVLISLSLPLLWMGVMAVHQGAIELSWGRSTHDLASNLDGRVERMSTLGGLPVSPELRGDHRLTMGEYVEYVGENPRAFLEASFMDLANMTLNSGINSFAGRYLGLYDMPVGWHYWSRIRDRDGFIGLVVAVYRYSKVLLLVNIVATVAWLVFLLGVAVGGWRLLRTSTLPKALLAAIFALPAYLALASQAATSVRWGLRTPFEFVLVLLFVFALRDVAQRVNGGPGPVHSGPAILGQPGPPA